MVNFPIRRLALFSLRDFIVLILFLIVTIYPLQSNSNLKNPSNNQLPVIAFSPNGKILASLNKDHTVSLRELVSGKQNTVLTSPNILITGLAFSPDSQILATLTNDSQIILWDINSGKQRLTLSNHSSAFKITYFIFSPNGGFLAGVGEDSSIILWDVITGYPIQNLSAHSSIVTSIAFNADGTMLASGGNDGHIKLWDVRSGQERFTFEQTNGFGITSIAFSPDNQTLLSVDRENHIVLYEIATTKKRFDIAGPNKANTVGIVWNSSGQLFATAGDKSEVVLWNPTTGRSHSRLYGQQTSIAKILFSYNNLSASLSQAGQIIIWDIVKGEEKKTFDGQIDFSFNPTGNLFASLNSDGEIILWDMTANTEKNLVANISSDLEFENLKQQSITDKNQSNRSLIDHQEANGEDDSSINKRSQKIIQITDTKNLQQFKLVTNGKPTKDDRKGIISLAISPDGSRLVSAGEDRKIRISDAKTSQQILTISGHHAAVSGVTFSVDGKRLISVSRDSEVRSWDTMTGQLSKKLLAHEHPIRAVAASPDGQFFASAGEETRVMLWDAKLGKLQKILNGHLDFVNAISFSPDGKILASAGADQRILLWDTATGKLLRTLRGHSSTINSIVFSPNGTLLASGGADSQIRIWNTMTGVQLQVLQGHQGAIRAIVFSSNGQVLASSGEDARILIWDMTTSAGKVIKSLISSTIVNALVFSRDGLSLFNSGEDNQIVEWDVLKGSKRKSILVLPGSAQAPSFQNKNYVVSNLKPALATDQPTDAVALPKPFLSGLLDWLIPSAEAAIPPPPGGPILVVTSSGATYSQYYTEILRTEGFNAFDIIDISSLNAAMLATHDVVILPPIPLSAAQVTLLVDWVNGGGNLITMRPDPQLASLLGITVTGSTLSDGFLLVDTSQSPGNGIVNQTIQFHGVADSYTSNSATTLATLYSNDITATTHPALTLRSIGTNGGQAAAFAYDLATSVIYTRQGNPAWAAQERDGYSPIRSDDKFYGNAIGDTQADWVNLAKVAIPQADEQQRLLANLILAMNADRKPLPRFWYLPRTNKAVVVMTGDDHGNNGTAGRFNQFKGVSQAGCSVKDWECVRGTSYLYPNTPLSNAEAAAYHADGFEIGLHLTTNCGDFTPASLEAFYTQQIAEWTTTYSSVPAPITQRHHCIAWSDWVTGAKVQLTHGIRLDTTYYFWPPGWVMNRPGFFTGSGMPMRFADLDGTLIDVYHAATQMTDESGQSYPLTINSLLDRSLGSEGYYGAFVINAHTDVARIPEADAVLASASARGVPIISSKQLLDWLDFRDTSRFQSIGWSGNALSFTVVPGTGSQNVPTNALQVLVPVQSSAGLLSTITLNSNPISFSSQTIKGVDYAAFAGAAGSYVVTYAADTTPPTVLSTTPTSGAIDISQGTIVTATFNEPIDVSTITSSTFILEHMGGAPVAATISYDASTRKAILTPNSILAPLTSYTATIKGGSADTQIKDIVGNALAANITWSFTTAAQPCVAIPCSAWPNSPPPGTPSVNDSNSVELGVKFRSDLDGFVTGIRFYQANPGTYTASLWSVGGQQLATGSMTAAASGWQQLNFSAPIAINANTVYVASYHAPNGNYAADSGYFANTGVDNPPMHLLQDGVSGGNGVYAYNTISTFPTNSYQSTNYWVSALFTTTTSPDTTPPTVTASSPIVDAIGIAPNTVVTATFSEAMDASSITTSTFELRDAANNSVSAAVSYDNASRTATLTPSATLTHSAVYTITLRGGASDPRLRDLAGNALATNVTWSFTTAAVSTGGCENATSLWPTNPTPATISGSDTSAVELGVKFRSTVNGFICGIRFYKGSTNTGTHTGTLWNSTGQQLAQATFTNETASGWQQANFATPVAITANTVYVASYHTPVGRYSVNENYFTAGVSSGLLYALSSAESTGNGVYLYGAGGFPSNSFQASNYWVDVLFTNTTGPDTTPPTVTATSPATNATGVNPSNPLTATFSEAIDPATISTSTFDLRDSGNALVATTVNYAANTATLTPNNALTATTTYTATVKGGASGVKDSVGNPLAADHIWQFTTGADPCAGGGNPIVCENTKIGNPVSEWDIAGAGDSSIQGFATAISVNHGETVRFKMDTPATDYRLDIYRLGYYDGQGARKVATVQPSVALPQTQPNCLINSTGLMDCGNWAESAVWAVPTDATSGIYFAKAVREDGANTGKASHIVFIVRNDASTSDILFQTSDTTWQAYNTYGGNSFYTGTGPGTGGSSNGRAYKLSYNRPFNTRAVDNGQDWLFNSEYPMVRWLEANGYHVSYFTGVDTDQRGALLQNHKLFLSIGHDEYWSDTQRVNVEAARNAGVHLAFFSGNEVFWKTRWENSIDSAGTLYRTLVCYKETHNFPNNPDPLANVWTGTWRDPRNSPPKDGGRPENALTGTLFTVNDGATTFIEVPAEDGKMRFWRNTSIANLAVGAKATLPFGTLGYEWDEDIDNGFRPAGLIRLSTTIVNSAPVLTDYGSSFGSGTAIHALTLYKHSSGALVFGAGTVQWSWGLDSNHDRGGTPADLAMQQATVNLFADMGTQPATLQPGLLTATASTDTTSPVSTITAPTTNSTIQPDSVITITGTASDVGGLVGGIEISVDGGTHWRRADGRANWSYTWTVPSTSGSVTIKSRAADDSGNLENPGPGITVTVSPGSDTAPPTVPVGLNAIATGTNQISLSWTASTDNVAVTSYQVERCQEAGCANFTQIGTPAATSFADSGLIAGTTYHYRVRATDAAGNLSGYSSVASVTTQAPPDTNTPTVPTGLSASPTASTQVSLIWTASTDNVAVTGYQVERCQGAGCASFTQVGTSTATSFADSGLVAGITYQYRVRAIDAAANASGYSNVVAVTTLIAPTAVSDIFLYRANVLRTVNGAGSLGLGVLANDTHPQNLPLTAQLVSGSLVGGGSLNLAANGSFTYLRTTASNTVSFRYRASDGTSLSEPTTGTTVNLRADSAPTTVSDNCSYDRSANTVTQAPRCTVIGTRTVRMNVTLNDTDPNATTNIPTDGIGKTVVPSTMRVTVVGTGAVVNANSLCNQSALGITAERATIVNNCDGTLTVNMTTLNTLNIVYSYVVNDDLGAQSAARSVTLSSVP